MKRTVVFQGFYYLNRKGLKLLGKIKVVKPVITYLN